MTILNPNCSKCGAPLVMNASGQFACANCERAATSVPEKPANPPAFNQRFFITIVALLISPALLNLLFASITKRGIAAFTFPAGAICAVIAAIMTVRRFPRHPVRMVLLAIFLIAVFAMASTFLQFLGCAATNSVVID